MSTNAISTRLAHGLLLVLLTWNKAWQFGHHRRCGEGLVLLSPCYWLPVNFFMLQRLVISFAGHYPHHQSLCAYDRPPFKGFGAGTARPGACCRLPWKYVAIARWNINVMLPSTRVRSHCVSAQRPEIASWCAQQFFNQQKHL